MTFADTTFRSVILSGGGTLLPPESKDLYPSLAVTPTRVLPILQPVEERGRRCLERSGSAGVGALVRIQSGFPEQKFGRDDEPQIPRPGLKSSFGMTAFC